jgi:hypothetical protein
VTQASLNRLWGPQLSETVRFSLPFNFAAVTTWLILQEDDFHMIIVNKLILKCNFTFFGNTQGVCLKESVCLCVPVYLGLCVLVCADGRGLCVFVCMRLWRETEPETKQSFYSCLWRTLVT